MWAACGHTKDNTYAVRGLLPGRSYRFRLCAVNKIGDSDFLTSEPVSVTEGEDSLVRYRLLNVNAKNNPPPYRSKERLVVL